MSITPSIKCGEQKLCDQCPVTSVGRDVIQVSAENDAFAFDFDLSLTTVNVWRVIVSESLKLMDDSDWRLKDVQSGNTFVKRLIDNDNKLTNRFRHTESELEQKLWLALSVTNVDLHDREKNEQLLQNTADQISLREGTKDYIDELIKRGFTVGIISYGIKEVIDRVLERSGLSIKAEDRPTGVEVIASSITEWSKNGNADDRTPITLSEELVAKIIDHADVFTQEALKELGLSDEAIDFINSIPVTPNSKGSKAEEMAGEKHIIAVGDSLTDKELLRVATHRIVVCNASENEVKPGSRALSNALLELASKVIRGDKFIEEMRRRFVFS